MIFNFFLVLGADGIPVIDPPGMWVLFNPDSKILKMGVEFIESSIECTRAWVKKGELQISS